MATDGTTERSTSIKGGLRPAVQLAGPASAQKVGEERHPRTRNRMARYVDVAPIIGWSIVIAIGIFLMAFGTTLALTVDPGSAYPNWQNITVTPFPAVK